MEEGLDVAEQPLNRLDPAGNAGSDLQSRAAVTTSYSLIDQSISLSLL